MNSTLAPMEHRAKILLNAIFCIALGAVFAVANAQTGVPNPMFPTVDSKPTNGQTRDANETAERSRMVQERKRVGEVHEAAKVACYKRFQVNVCLNDARTAHNSAQSDLKRQETTLNDLQRKRRAAEQVRKVEAKSSPQSQEQVAQQRGQALASQAKRQQRQKERAAPPAAKAKAQPKVARPAPQARTTDAAQRQARAQSKMAEQQQKNARAPNAKVQHEQRQREAAEHVANVQARQKKNKKPPSAPLPVPPN